MFFYILAPFAFLASSLACTPTKDLIWSGTQSADFNLTKLIAMQKGQPVDKHGIDPTVNLDIIMEIEVAYPIHHPNMRGLVTAMEYVEYGGKCQWRKWDLVWFNWAMTEMDPCKILDNCYLNNDPTTLVATINIKQHMGQADYVENIKANNYYGLSFWLNDGQNPMAYIYIQNVFTKV